MRILKSYRHARLYGASRRVALRSIWGPLVYWALVVRIHPFSWDLGVGSTPGCLRLYLGPFTFGLDF